MKKLTGVVLVIILFSIILFSLISCSTTSSSATTTTTTTTTTSTSEDTTTTTTTSTTSSTGASTTTTTTTTTSTTTTTILVGDGLVAYYAFEEGEGTTITDSSGNGNNATLVDGTWSTGLIGDSCLLFDGVDDAVVIPGPGEDPPDPISSLEEGSISLWFSFDGVSGDFLPLFYHGPTAEVDTKDGLVIEVAHGQTMTGTRLYYTVTNSNETVPSDEVRPISCYDSLTDLTSLDAYHYVAIVDENGNTGFLNGEEMTDRNYNFGDETFQYFLGAVNSGLLAIGQGRFAADGVMYYFKGKIDEVRIYNRALTTAEVQALYAE